MILSIQSHVAFGRVGNRSAVFPLELIGHEVIAINTVQFSNHTGYGKWTGQLFDESHIRELLDGIGDRGALGCDAVLSGYMGSSAIGGVILEALDRVRAINKNAIFCLDPVMGDYGRGFFVRPGIPEFIKTEALSRATIITPNQFEAEYLADMKIISAADAREAALRIRERGPRIVLITSFQADAQDTGISIYLSDAGSDYLITTDRLTMNPEPNGAGDLCAALFLGHYLNNGDAPRSLEMMTNSVYSVFSRTKASGKRELQLVDARFDIINAPKVYRVKSV